MSTSASNPNSNPTSPVRTHLAIADPHHDPTSEPTCSHSHSHSHSHYDLTTILQSHPPSRTSSPCHVESFFDDAFRSTPSPPPSSFIDTILNPTDARRHVFGYHRVPDSPTRQRPHSPIGSSLVNDMPSARRPPSRSGYVDLTRMPDPPAKPPARPQSRRQSSTPGPSSKRLKQNSGAALDPQGEEVEATVEEIDLSNDEQTVQDILQKQREDAVKAQEKPEEKAITFNSFTCVICMDMPTDLTATACGHLFCHMCLNEALIVGENRAAPGEPKRSQCPVCRKHINRSKTSEMIPLLLKRGLTTQPRKKAKVVTPPKVAS